MMRAVGCLLVSGLATIAPAQGVESTPGAAENVRWRLLPLVGEPQEGRILGLDETGAAIRVEGDGGVIQTLELDRLDRAMPIPTEGVPRSGSPDSVATLWLEGGGRLDLARPLAVVPGGLRLKAAGLVGEATVPSQAVRAFAVEPAPVGFEAALGAPGEGRDLLFAEGSQGVQRLGVEVLRFESQGVVVAFQGKERPPLAWERVQGLVLTTKRAGQRVPAAAGPQVVVHLNSGSVLRGALTGWDAGAAVVTTRAGASLPLRPTAIERLEVSSSLRTWLSALEPSRVEQQPALDRAWPWLVDRAPGGDGIRLGGNSWRRGLVLVPRTRLDYAIGGAGYTRFRAVLGLDERAGMAGHAVMRILGDGKLLHSTGPMRAGSLPQRVELDIRGVATLTLETDFGERLDFGDHCAFAGAALLRDGQAR